MSAPHITMYTTPLCGDCRRAKQFLNERGVEFHEVNIDESTDGEDLVLRVNDDLRKVPTFEVDGWFFRSARSILTSFLKN